MAGARTASSKAKDQGTALELAVARDRQCDFLCHAVRLRLAAAARGLPPWSTVYRQFAAWRDGCVFERINHALVIVDRERVGREASPSAAIIDSHKVSRPRKPVACAAMMQARRSTSASATSSSTPTDERSCSNRIPRAFRIATAARCSALPVPCIRSSRASSPIAVTTHEQIANATNIVVEIVRKIAGQVGFVVLPRRWVVERFFAWITKTEGLRKISKRQSTRPEPSSTPPQSCCSLAVSLGKPEFRNRLSG